MPSKEKKLLIVGLSLALIPGIALLNLSCALYERLVYGAFWEEGRPKGLYLNSNADRPKLTPGAHLNGWRYDIKINNLGFRGKELGPKPPNGYRIWCIGGSTTFDLYASDNYHTWPVQLENKLQTMLPERTVEVINAGVPGEIFWGSKESFLEHLPIVQPDMVLIYHGPNDLRKQAEMIGRPGQGNQEELHHPGHRQPKQGQGPQAPAPPELAADPLPNPPPFEPGQFALGRAFGNWAQARQALPDHLQSNRFTTDDIVNIEHDVLEFIRVARHNNVVPVLITHPTKAKKGDQGERLNERIAEASAHFKMPSAEVLRGFVAYNSMLQRLAKRERVSFIDLVPLISADDDLWGDALHFSDAGSELVSTLMSERLQPIIKP